MSTDRIAVQIHYTNHRGETARRRIIPHQIRFGASEWHPREQWLLDAYDVDKQAERSFALADIREWTANPPPPAGPGQEESR
jgi:predicted DNA-binding transcriptional regulator YafY